MTPDQFAQMTQRIVARDGFDGYLPTACYPVRREVAVLEGMPNGVNVEAEAVAWAARRAEVGEEFLVAFKYDDAHFKVVRFAGEDVQSGIYAVEGTVQLPR